jgi:DNA helicase-2/ATP-dependent DNA helicase PcrA
MQSLDAQTIEGVFGFTKGDKGFLDGLNEEQIEAVSHVEGPLAILAGAGTGKTTVVSRRIAMLVKHRHAAPEDILALTFTKKAAREMKERVAALLGSEVGKKITLTNFHGFCNDLLRKHGKVIGISDNFSILDEEDSLELLGRIAMARGLCSPQDKATLREILSRISTCKEEGYNVAMIASASKKDLPASLRTDIAISQDKFLLAWREFDAAKAAMDVLDFGDLLVYTTQLLRRYPKARAAAATFRFILVDEYQDTSPVQAALVRLLARGHDNVAVVGDTDQSIYEWRSARPWILSNFAKDWDGCKVVGLVRNYRSTQEILDLGNAIVAPLRKSDGMVKALRGIKTGPAPSFRTYTSEIEEAQNIAGQIEESVKGGRLPGDHAILTRTAKGLLNVQQVLTRRGVKTVTAGERATLDDPMVIRGLAALRLSENPRDFTALLKLADALQVTAGETGRLEREIATTRVTIPDALRALHACVPPNSVEGTRWSETLRKVELIMASRNEATVADTLTNVEAVLQGSSTPEISPALVRVMNLAKGFNRPIDFIEVLALDADLRDGMDKDRVVLSTIHSAKGLEFDVVFLPGFNEGTLPSARALASPHGAMEERRLAHVAITRAKTELFLSAKKGSESSYLAELGFVESVRKTVVKRAGRRLKRAF